MMRNTDDIVSDMYKGNDKEKSPCQHHLDDMKCCHDKDDDCNKEQRHTHEYLGSVKIAEAQEDPHNHRLACVTGQAILLTDGNHYHELADNTDFYENHFHRVMAKTGLNIPVGNDRHVHFVTGNTTVNDGHRHEFQFATLIDNPIGE